MIDKDFRVVLDWFMVSDPWPLTEEAHETILALVNYEAQQRNYESWVDAYHEFSKDSG